VATVIVSKVVVINVIVSFLVLYWRSLEAGLLNAEVRFNKDNSVTNYNIGNLTEVTLYCPTQV
jgi:hypothetical protein